MIKPHGLNKLNPLFVYDSVENKTLLKEARELTAIVISSASAANAVQLGGGYFNPLTGYMSKADTLSVATGMKMTSGLFWPIPILNLVKNADGIKPGERIALRDPNVHNNPVLAIMDIEEIEEFTRPKVAQILMNYYKSIQ